MLSYGSIRVKREPDEVMPPSCLVPTAQPQERTGSSSLVVFFVIGQIKVQQCSTGEDPFFIQLTHGYYGEKPKENTALGEL